VGAGEHRDSRRGRAGVGEGAADLSAAALSGARCGTALTSLGGRQHAGLDGVAQAVVLLVVTCSAGRDGEPSEALVGRSGGGGERHAARSAGADFGVGEQR
jgi:hypothetical protein